MFFCVVCIVFELWDVFDLVDWMVVLDEVVVNVGVFVFVIGYLLGCLLFVYWYVVLVCVVCGVFFVVVLDLVGLCFLVVVVVFVKLLCGWFGCVLVLVIVSVDDLYDLFG